MTQQTQKEVTVQIKSQLLRLSRQKLTKMYQDKKQTPSLIIPKNLPTFIRGQKYSQLIQCVYKYCQMFNSMMKRYTQLKQVLKNRMGNQLTILQKERQDLQAIQKQLSFHYAIILLDNTCKSAYKDQFFFQTLIYLISRVMKQLFLRDQFILIEEQLNRLFRTNRYNLIKKRHQNDQIMKQFPILKDAPNKIKYNKQYILNKLPQKMDAYRQLQKLQKKNHSKSAQNDYSKMMGISQIKDEEQRSPLLCTWLPSKRSMLNQYLRPIHKSMLKRQDMHQINHDSRVKHFTLD